MFYMSKEGMKESDEGAKGQCQKCGRYSNNKNCLTTGYKCECGQADYYSGSFKKPDKNSVFEKEVKL